MSIRQSTHKVTVTARSPIAAWAARRKMIDQFIWLDRLQFLWKAEQSWSCPKPPDSELPGPFDLVISFLGGPAESISKRLTEIFSPDRVIYIDPRPSERTMCEGVHITQQWINEIRRQRPHLEFEISNLKSPF